MAYDCTPYRVSSDANPEIPWQQKVLKYQLQLLIYRYDKNLISGEKWQVGIVTIQKIIKKGGYQASKKIYEG